MAISLSCTCGKTLQVKDELAGRRIKCPACAIVLSVPAPEPEILEDLEDAEVHVPPKKKKRAEAEDDADDRPKKKKKKKKNGKMEGITPLTKKEKREQEFEREREKAEKIKRFASGSAYLGLGLIIVIGTVYAIFTYGMALWESPMYGLIILVSLVIGLGAVGKGILALAFGQME
jgi:hypothetical protein